MLNKFLQWIHAGDPYYDPRCKGCIHVDSPLCTYPISRKEAKKFYCSSMNDITRMKAIELAKEYFKATGKCSDPSNAKIESSLLFKVMMELVRFTKEHEKSINTGRSSE